MWNMAQKLHPDILLCFYEKMKHSPAWCIFPKNCDTKWVPDIIADIVWLIRKSVVADAHWTYHAAFKKRHIGYAKLADSWCNSFKGARTHVADILAKKYVTLFNPGEMPPFLSVFFWICNFFLLRSALNVRMGMGGSVFWQAEQGRNMIYHGRIHENFQFPVHQGE